MTFDERNNRGFILPLTLWIIASIGLISALIFEWVSEAVSNATAIQNKAEASLQFANTRNELIFAIARLPSEFRGIRVGDPISFMPILDPIGTPSTENTASEQIIFLDGRTYVMASNTQYAIKLHDGRGLLNLNVINASLLNRFFEAIGVEEDRRSLLTDTLLDYRDEDDLTRLSGAEKDDYQRLNLHPPTDYQLVTPWEAQRIIGWSNLDELWKRQYEAPLLTTCRSNGFNPNTAPPEALSTYIDGLSIENTSQLVRYRDLAPLRNIQNVGEAVGQILVAQPFFYSFLPGRCFVIDLIDRNTNERIRFSLTLLRREQDQPWQIDYVLRIPKPYEGSLDVINPEITFPSPENLFGGSG